MKMKNNKKRKRKIENICIKSKIKEIKLYEDISVTLVIKFLSFNAHTYSKINKIE